MGKESTVSGVSDVSPTIPHFALLVMLTCLVYANRLHGDFVHHNLPALVTNEDALGTASMDIRDGRSHKSYRTVTVLTYK